VQALNYAGGRRGRRLRRILDFESVIYIIFIMTLPDSSISQKLTSLKKPKFRSKFKCLVRFDNESGKGDHKHVGSQEESYQFIDVETLVTDFLAEIEKARRK